MRITAQGQSATVTTEAELRAEVARLRSNEAALKATVQDLQRVCQAMARQGMEPPPVIVTPFLRTH